MRTLAPTHQGTPPALAEPGAETPRSRAGQRLLDLKDQPVRFPSDAFCGRDTITRGDWERRHAATYGDRGHGAELTVFVLLLFALLAFGLVALVDAIDTGTATEVLSR